MATNILRVAVFRTWYCTTDYTVRRQIQPTRLLNRICRFQKNLKKHFVQEIDILHQFYANKLLEKLF